MKIIHAVLALAAALPAVAHAAEQNDLRQLHVGMPVAELPATGYGGFTCVGNPATQLSSWNDYRSCPMGQDHHRAVGFHYTGDRDSKTQVGGQPVNLALLIDDDARVAGMTIDTDPTARLYLHKKAYLFALQVKARFGEEGWTCQKIDPTATEQPVGGVFVHEHCEKLTETRHFIMDRALFRDPAKDLRDFTDATQLTILHVS